MRGSVCHIPNMSDCYRKIHRRSLYQNLSAKLLSQRLQRELQVTDSKVVTKWQQAQAPALKLEPCGVLEERYMLDSQPIPLATAG